jgi:CheY-like chemotaxis protein
VKGERDMARVLIVEDENPLRRIITLNLVRRGYEVAEADSAATALEALEAWSGAFDVILLDINLPDQTGWDVLRYLNTLSAASPSASSGQPARRMPKVIVISAVRPPQSRIEEFQPDAVLVKPFPMQALFRLIERVLSSTPAEVEVGDTGETEEADELADRDAEAPAATGSSPG